MRALERLALASAALALGAALPGGAWPAASPETARRVTCAFSHPSYSGYCRETRPIPKDGTGNAVCADLLRCLNDVRCVETLCQATTIRGGWKLERVEEQKEKK